MNLFVQVSSRIVLSKKIKSLLCSSLMIIFVIGCAETTSNLSMRLDKWKGKSTSELVKFWGQPKAVSEHSNATHYDFDYTERKTKDILLPTTSDGATVLKLHPVMIGIKHKECRVTFYSTVVGEISHVEWHGPDHSCSLYINSQPEAPA